MTPTVVIIYHGCKKLSEWHVTRELSKVLTLWKNIFFSKNQHMILAMQETQQKVGPFTLDMELCLFHTHGGGRVIIRTSVYF